MEATDNLVIILRQDVGNHRDDLCVLEILNRMHSKTQESTSSVPEYVSFWVLFGSKGGLMGVGVYRFYL